MITAYALLLDRCGLSHREAANLHGVRPDTVKSWSAGRNPAPDRVIADLRDLYGRIERAAEEALRLIASRPATDDVELSLVNDDAEAQSLGWPAVGAQAAMLGLVAARGVRPMRIVSRGSTPASAAAAQAHRR
jgi:hypothetical protein